MLQKYKHILGNECGNVLVLAVMVMVALTALALVSSRISNTNVATATNEKFHKSNFFKTDADMEVATELMINTVVNREIPTVGSDLGVRNQTFIYNKPGVVCPDESNADVVFSANKDSLIDPSADPNYKNNTFITYSVDEMINPGNAIQIAEGYHGRGKGLASGGLLRVYNTRGFGRGLGNSQTRITSRYQHVP